MPLRERRSYILLPGRGLSREQNGIISAAGPVINLVLCALFAALFFIAGGASLLAEIGLAGVRINAMIAAFNLIPVSILDGTKVWAWNKPAFLILIIAAFGILYASFSLIH